jgi:hypothetical protein
MIQKSLAILILLFICSLAMAFVPSSFGGYRRQTHLCAEPQDPFDMDDQSIPEDPHHKPFHWSDSFSRPPPTSVFIILFRPGTKDEGVHTIEYPRNSGNNVILAFEAKHDCDKFAGALKEQDFFEPLVRTCKECARGASDACVCVRARVCVCVCVDWKSMTCLSHAQELSKCA